MENILILFVIGILIFVFAYLKSKGTVSRRKPKYDKGSFGERTVRMVIGETIEGEKYVLNNYLVEYDGKTSQIDHIVINRNGIFVIETKNYAGRIYGNEHQYEWTQVLAYGKVKNKLYNPLKQNATHIYRINRILKGKINIKSLVVFVQNNTRYIQANNVIPLSSLARALTTNYGETLNAEQMKSLYESLLASRTENNETTDFEHIKGINQMKQNLENNICPRCNGKLVERKGKYGIFLGCDNYPNCKFIKK